MKQQNGKPWPIFPLVELADDERNAITDGPFGSKLKTEHYTSAGPRVIRLKNIGDVEFVDAKAYISEAHFLTLQKHRVFPGDIVIAALGENPPRSCLIPESVGPAVVKADCIRFKAGPRVLPKFLNYVLNAPDLRRHAKGIIHGVGRPRLNLGEIKALPIPVPSLPEQRRIVAEIEKQFTRLEAGVTALRRVQANFKRYRAAVLKAACEGKLVPTEAELQKSAGKGQQGFESGEQLLKRILAKRRDVFEHEKALGAQKKYVEPSPIEPGPLPNVPDGWTLASAEAVSSSVRDGTHDTPNYVQNGVPLITSKNLLPTGLDFENVKLISREDHIEIGKRSGVERGDILFAMIGTIGNPVVVETDLEFCIKNVGLFKSNSEFILPRFLRYWLMSPSFSRWLEPKQRGTTQKFVLLGLLRALVVALPPLAEQTRIVAEVERRLSVVEELESVVSANLQRATRLRQSILQKAFSD